MSKLHGGMLKLIARSGWDDGCRGEKEQEGIEGAKSKDMMQYSNRELNKPSN